MEAGDVERVIKDPKNPYTQLLVNSIPWPDPNLKWGAAVESPKEKFKGVNNGCRFANRCPHVFDKCIKAPPPMYMTSPDQATACYLYENSDVLAHGDLQTLFKSMQANRVKPTP